MRSVSRDQLMEEGYIILRNVIPPEQLDALRATYEVLVERQKGIWARERKPTDPPGGVWESYRQPRMVTNQVVDAAMASAVELWLHENIHGVSSQLLGVPDAAVTQMLVMCNPVRDHGPAEWHRDTSPTAGGPLAGLQDVLFKYGPKYVQWNIPLYDDNVLWVVPRSHQRLNTEEENRHLLENPRAPLPGGTPVELNAGDGVVYINLMLHWGSNYSAKLRRTIHGGFTTTGFTEDIGFAEHLSPSARERFARWSEHAARQRDQTEAAFRAIIAKDEAGFRAGLAALHLGEEPHLARIISLCKFAYRIWRVNQSDVAGLPMAERARAINLGTVHHLNQFQRFANRFTRKELDTLWRRFGTLDAKLQAETEEFVPGFQSGPTRYRFNEMPGQFRRRRFHRKLELTFAQGYNSLRIITENLAPEAP